MDIIIIVIGFFLVLVLVISLAHFLQGIAARKRSERIKSDPVLFVVEDALLASASPAIVWGDLFVSKDQMVFLPLSYIDGSDPRLSGIGPGTILAAGGGLLGTAVGEAVKKSRNSEVEKMIDGVKLKAQAYRPIGNKETLVERMKKWGGFGDLLERTEIKAIEMEDNVITIRLKNAPSAPRVFAFLGNKPAPQTKEALTQWLKS